MSKEGRYIIIVSLILFFSKGLLAQDISEFRQDTTQTESYKKKNSFKEIFKNNPGRSAFYSFVLPGAGQWNNKRYWKVPLVLAAEGYAVYYLSDRISAFKASNDCYIGYVEHNSRGSICENDVSSVSSAFSKRSTRRNEKEIAWIALGAVHLLNVLDAFIDRHLIEFDISDDLSFQNPRSEFTHLPQVTLLSITIPLNKMQ